jgi:hypothetical protein
VVGVEGGCVKIKAGKNKDAKEKQRTPRKPIYSKYKHEKQDAKVKDMGAKRL